MTEYIPTPEDDELEDTIGDLFYRLKRAREGSAEYKMIVRQLKGLQKGSEIGGLIFEEFGMNGRGLIPRQAAAQRVQRDFGAEMPCFRMLIFLRRDAEWSGRQRDLLLDHDPWVTGLGDRGPLCQPGGAKGRLRSEFMGCIPASMITRSSSTPSI